MENSLDYCSNETEEVTNMFKMCLSLIDTMISWINSQIDQQSRPNPDLEKMRKEFVAMRAAINDFVNNPNYDEIGNARNCTQYSNMVCANESHFEPDYDTDSDDTIAFDEEFKYSAVKDLEIIFGEQSGNSDNGVSQEQGECSQKRKLISYTLQIQEVSDYYYMWTPPLVRMWYYVIEKLKYLIKEIKRRNEIASKKTKMDQLPRPVLNQSKTRNNMDATKKIKDTYLLSEQICNYLKFLCSTILKNSKRRAGGKAVLKPDRREPVRKPPVFQLVRKPVFEQVSEPVTEPVGEPVLELVSEPVTEPVGNPVFEVVSDPVTKPGYKLVCKPGYKLVCKPGYKWVCKPVSKTNPSPQVFEDKKSTNWPQALVQSTDPNDLKYAQRLPETCLMSTNNPGQNRGFKSSRTSTSQDKTSSKDRTLGSNADQKNQQKNERKETSKSRKRKNFKKRRCGSKKSRNTFRRKGSDAKSENAERERGAGRLRGLRPAYTACETARNDSDSSSTEEEEYFTFKKRRRLYWQRLGQSTSPSAQRKSNFSGYVAQRARSKNKATNPEQGKEPNKSNQSAPNFDSDESFGGTTEEESMTLPDEGPQSVPSVIDDGSSAYNVTTDEGSSSAETVRDDEAPDQGQSDDSYNAYDAPTDEDTASTFSVRDDESQDHGGNDNNTTDAVNDLQINEQSLSVSSFIQEESPHWRIENVFSLQTDESWSFPPNDNAEEFQENTGNNMANFDDDVPTLENGHSHYNGNVGQFQENYWHVMNAGNVLHTEENGQFPFNANIGQPQESVWNTMATGNEPARRENCHFHFNGVVGQPQENHWHCMSAGNAVQADEHHQFQYSANAGETQENYWYGMGAGNYMHTDDNCQFPSSGNIGVPLGNGLHGMNTGNVVQTDENSQFPCSAGIGESQENIWRTRTTEHCVEIQENRQVVYTVKIEESQEYYMNYTFVPEANCQPSMDEPSNVLGEGQEGLPDQAESGNDLITGEDIYLNCPMQLCDDNEDSQEYRMEGNSIANRDSTQMYEESSCALSFKVREIQEQGVPYDEVDEGALGDDEDEESSSVICIDDVKSGKKKVKSGDVQTSTEIASERPTEKKDRNEGEEDDDENENEEEEEENENEDENENEEEGGDEDGDENDDDEDKQENETEEDEQDSENEEGEQDNENEKDEQENENEKDEQENENEKDEQENETDEDEQENENEKDEQGNENEDKDEGSESVICLDDVENAGPQGSCHSSGGSASGLSIDRNIITKYFPKEFKEEMKQKERDRNSQKQSSSKNAESSANNVNVSTEDKGVGNNLTTICTEGGEKRKGGHGPEEKKHGHQTIQPNPAAQKPNEQNRSQQSLSKHKWVEFVDLSTDEPSDKFCVMKIDKFGTVKRCFSLPGRKVRIIDADTGSEIGEPQTLGNAGMESGSDDDSEPEVIPQDDVQSDLNESGESDGEDLTVVAEINVNPADSTQTVIRHGRNLEPTARQTNSALTVTPAVATTTPEVRPRIRKTGSSPAQLNRTTKSLLECNTEDYFIATRLYYLFVHIKLNYVSVLFMEQCEGQEEEVPGDSGAGIFYSDDGSIYYWKYTKSK